MYLMLLILFGCSLGNEPQPLPPVVETEVTWSFSVQSLTFDAKGNGQTVIVTANGDWSAESDQLWCAVSPGNGHNGQTSLKVMVTPNPGYESRTAKVLFTAGERSSFFTVTQDAGAEENYVPEGYAKVWGDEFDSPRLEDGKPAMPDTGRWWFETGDHGWGNNEIQNYIDRYMGLDTCAVVTDGTLKIIAKKRGDEVVSIRMNSKESWLYGYFEARLRMPGGRGTWPAFWMLPEKQPLSWPLDGEIDIMEYVGYRPDVVQSSVHTQAFNHTIGTEKTATRAIENAETAFHVYAVEWTPGYIKGFVDGVNYFTFLNDGEENVETWPFDKPFYLKLNLAWGGNWGGQQGLDETALPAVYEIDYVRVYEKVN